MSRIDGRSLQSGPLSFARKHINSGAKIEAALYHAHIPERYLRGLTRKLLDTPQKVMSSAVMLFEGLKEDGRLTDDDRIKLLPSLVGLVKRYGAEVHTNTRYIDAVVDDYLLGQHQRTTKGDEHDSLTTSSRKRDRHASERKITYGNESMEINYGLRSGGYGDKIKGKVPASRTPSKRMVKKAIELVKAVNRSNWQQATERYHDITQMQGHLFYNLQTYRQFLIEVGSVILQKSGSHKFEMIDVEHYGFPSGYKIGEPESSRPKQQHEKKPKIPVKDGFVDMRGRSKRIFVADGAVVAVLSSAPRIESRRPHPKLERIIASRRV